MGLYAANLPAPVETRPPDSEPVNDAMIAALRAGLPESYTVWDSEGPEIPAKAVPYIVVFPDVGELEGRPFCPDRDLQLMPSIRGIGSTPTQARRAAQRARRIVLDGFAVAGRHIETWQELTTATERDDSVSPAIFSQLVVFGVRSQPA